jgi:hypothetical protein
MTALIMVNEGRDHRRVDAATRNREQVAAVYPFGIAVVTSAEIPIGMVAQGVGRFPEK